MRVALAVTAILLLAGCATSGEPEAVETATTTPLGDPLAVGGLTSTLLPFDLGQHVIEGGGNARYLVHIHGETTLPEGDGPFPTVIMMHGRHGTCATPVSEVLLQPCPDTPATGPVDSYTGYRYLAEHLAGHGIASISVDANNVNDRDNDWAIAGGDYGMTARARIVIQVMEALDDAAFGEAAGKFDPKSLGLMGHSRGGEGVIRAAGMLAGSSMYDVRAVFALAPTYFRDWGIDDVAFGTIVPYCDGDVYSLHGTQAFHSAGYPAHQFLHMGANHNYYNTVWTGDDAGRSTDPYCGADEPGSGRLDPETQRLEGMAIMGSFFRVYLGLENELRPFLLGEAVLPGDVRISAKVPTRLFTRIDNAEGGHGHGMVYEGVDYRLCSEASCADETDAFVPEALRVSWEAGARIDPGIILGDDEVLVIPMAFDDVTLLDHVFLEWKDGQRWSLAELGAQPLPGAAWRKLVLTDLVVPAPVDGGALQMTMDTAGEGLFGPWVVRQAA